MPKSPPSSNLNSLKIEGTQFGLYGILSVLSLLMFSLIDEDGRGLEEPVQTLEVAFQFCSIGLFLLLIYDSFVRPRLFPNARTDAEGEGKKEGSGRWQDNPQHRTTKSFAMTGWASGL